MNRADFWCRVIGWVQIGGGVLIALTIFAIAKAMDLAMFHDVAASVIQLVLIFFLALPEFFAGLFTVMFAGSVTHAQQGGGDDGRIVLRVLMGLSGLWSAGVIGFFGLAAPHLGLFAFLGLLSTVFAALGPVRTADLLQPDGPQS